MNVLSVNSGSSSIKFALYPIQNKAKKLALLSGIVNFSNTKPYAKLTVSQNNEVSITDFEISTKNSLSECIKYISNYVKTHILESDIDAIAHRVVHGGSKYQNSILINDFILDELTQLESLAPLHQPFNLQGIRLFQEIFPNKKQFACFDTGFHQHLSQDEFEYPLSKTVRELGIRRYGYHGLSYRYILHTLNEKSTQSKRKGILAHIGNGVSMCAVNNGKSYATTMGFSTLDGLMMGSRSGQIDPGILLFLMESGWTHDQIKKSLYKESGILGLSEYSSDMKELRNRNDPKDQMAIRIFSNQLTRQIGAFTAALNGINFLAFTGGIGEHDQLLRSNICTSLSFLNAQIDSSLNKTASLSNEPTLISTVKSQFEIWVVPTDEGYIAASDAAELLSQSI
jgi:acetate kinase